MAMRASGLTQSMLAEKVGISRQYLSRVMIGDRSGDRYWPAFAQALGVKIEWLTTGSPTHAPSWARVRAMAESEAVRQLATADPLNPADLPTTDLLAHLEACQAELSRRIRTGDPGPDPILPRRQHPLTAELTALAEQVEQH